MFWQLAFSAHVSSSAQHEPATQLSQLSSLLSEQEVVESGVVGGEPPEWLGGTVVFDVPPAAVVAIVFDVPPAAVVATVPVPAPPEPAMVDTVEAVEVPPPVPFVEQSSHCRKHVARLMKRVTLSDFLVRHFDMQLSSFSHAATQSMTAWHSGSLAQADASLQQLV